MNWMLILLHALTLVSPVVKAVEQLSDEAASGADKKTLAEDSIAAATGIAQQELSPADAQKAAVVSAIVSSTIDSTVKQLNDSGTMPAKIIAVVEQGVTNAALATAVATGAIDVQQTPAAGTPGA